MGRADHYRHGENNVICDRCGLKYKASDLKREWNGLYTCPYDWEPRHPQDLIKSKHDDQRPSLSRPETSESFVPNIAVPTNVLGPWINTSGVTIGSDLTITKTGGSDGVWDATAISTGSIDGDGYMEFTTNEFFTFRMIGFVESDPVSDTDIKWGIFLIGTAPGDSLGKVEGDGNTSSLGSGKFLIGDVLRIQREGSVISYLQNGVVIEVSAVASSPIVPLFVKCTLNDLPSTITDPVLFDDQVEQPFLKPEDL